MGPITSLSLGILLGEVGYNLTSQGNVYLGKVFGMGGSFGICLAVFNLLALGNLDGGRFFQAIYASIAEYKERWVWIPMTFTGIVLVIGMILYRFNVDLLLLFPWYLISFYKSRHMDKAEDAYTEYPWQIVLFLVIYVVLCVITIDRYVAYPSWIEFFSRQF